jgi:preprotein translocase subunit SecG
MANPIPDLTDKASRIEVVLFIILALILIGFVVFQVARQLGTGEPVSKATISGNSQ